MNDVPHDASHFPGESPPSFLTAGVMIADIVDALRRRGLVLLVIATVVAIPPVLITWFQFLLQSGTAPEGLADHRDAVLFTLNGIRGVAQLALSLVVARVVGALHFGAPQRSLGHSLVVYARCLVALVLSWVGSVVGIILFLFPGLHLILRWYLVAPVALLEERGVLESLSRSAELMHGHKMTVFGFWFAAALVGVPLTMLVAFRAGLSAPPDPWGLLAVGSVLTLLANCMNATIYCRLRLHEAETSTPQPS